VSRRPSPFPTGGQPPIGLAHRGGLAEQVENSPSAFEHAIDLGFRYIETDIRASIDGHAVIHHDATLDRMTDGTGTISALPLSRILAARLPNGDHPMTLLQALERWPDAVLNVDVKADDAVGPFLRAVARADAWERVCAASFSAARLRRLCMLAGPRLARSLGTSEVVRLRLRAPVDTGSACAVQVPAASGRIPLVTPGFLRRAHDRGLAVHVWTVNDPVQMRHLLAMGVDGLVTDRPSVLADVLEEFTGS
jgi:glycerophosphoryl diester phosphodiesterase